MTTIHTRREISGREAADWEIATQDRHADKVRTDDVRCMRTRQVDAGEMRYIEIYPVLRTRGSVRRARAAATKEAQDRANRRRAKERVEQLIHANFDEHDVFATLTYREDDARVGDDEVRRDVQAYIRRLKRISAKRGEELRYIYVLELPERADGDMRAYRESMGWHVHLIVHGVTRDEAEDAWRWGMANSRRLKDSDERFTGLAKYMLKRRDSARMWARSRNLAEPEVRVTDRRPAKAAMARVAEDARVDGRRILEALYPEYRVLEDPAVQIGSILPGAYIRVRMRRR